MKTSADGRKKIMEREGFRLRAYKDSVGIWTIGVGHTSMAGPPKVTPGLVLTKAQVEEILTRDLEQFERAVNSAIKQPLSQGQFDALVSLAFNIGAGGFKKSTVVRRINAGNYRGAADAFLLWNKPPELMPRRKAERAQFLAASGTHAPGEPVRFMPRPDLHDDEDMNADYLRAAGSRVITQTDKIRSGVQTAAGAAAAAGALASNVSQISDSIGTVKQGASDGKEMLVGVLHYWPYAALAVLVGISVLALWRVWKSSQAVEAARVEDAAYTPQEGV